MVRKVCCVLFLLVLAAGTLSAQMPGGYLDVETVQLKPEKASEFEAAVKKMVEANRRKGDTWLTFETIYGRGYEETFISNRADHAALDKAMADFMGALNKAYGEAGSKKLFQDYNTTVTGSRSELRRRRWDLSCNPPADAAAYTKWVGDARFARIIRVRARQGRFMQLEEGIKQVKSAEEKASPPVSWAVSMSADGTSSGIYYITTLASSMAGFDGGPSLRELLGEEEFKNFENGVSETVAEIDTAIYRIVPELSNPPEAIREVAPDFWTPKPKPAAKPKAKAAEPPKSQ
jgi:hypothetical protein